MNSLFTPTITRRNWLRSGARYVTLTGIGLLTGNLLWRDRGACFRRAVACPDCRLLAHCGFSRARQARRRPEEAAR